MITTSLLECIIILITTNALVYWRVVTIPILPDLVLEKYVKCLAAAVAVAVVLVAVSAAAWAAVVAISGLLVVAKELLNLKITEVITLINLEKRPIFLLIIFILEVTLKIDH